MTMTTCFLACSYLRQLDGVQGKVGIAMPFYTRIDVISNEDLGALGTSGKYSASEWRSLTRTISHESNIAPLTPTKAIVGPCAIRATAYSNRHIPHLSAKLRYTRTCCASLILTFSLISAFEKASEHFNFFADRLITCTQSECGDDVEQRLVQPC